MHNIVQEMQKLNIDILGISEARWPKSGNFPLTNGMVYYSGNQCTHHRHVVAIFVSKSTMQSIINFTPVSKLILVLHIIQIYAPTADAR